MFRLWILHHGAFGRWFIISQAYSFCCGQIKGSQTKRWLHHLSFPLLFSFDFQFNTRPEVFTVSEGVKLRKHLQTWGLFLSLYWSKVKAQQRVLEHMMLWHKHQLDCTTLIRIDEWRESRVGWGWGVALYWDSSSLSTRAEKKQLPECRSKSCCRNKDTSICFPSSLNVYRSAVFTAKCFLSCHNFTVMPSCPGWTPAVYDVCKWSPKSQRFITFTGLEMKAYS